jgi:hypothetical protein
MNFLLVTLVLTFLITRSWAYFGYRKNNYFDSVDNPKTLAGWLRKKTGFAWHSIHFATIIFFIASFLIYADGFTAMNNIILGISLSLIMDQIFPLIGNWDYFGKKMFTMSILLHMIAALIAIQVF